MGNIGRNKPDKEIHVVSHDVRSYTMKKVVLQQLHVYNVRPIGETFISCCNFFSEENVSVTG